MSVTQDYKLPNLTPEERTVIAIALRREMGEIQKIADAYPKTGNFANMLQSLLFDLKSALQKVSM